MHINEYTDIERSSFLDCLNNAFPRAFIYKVIWTILSTLKHFFVLRVSCKKMRIQNRDADRIDAMSLHP